MRFLLIGPSGTGKTAFCRVIAGQAERQASGPTQMIAFLGDYIDTPGVYLEQPRFYSALITFQQQADAVVLMVASDQEGQPFPDGFAQMFSRPIFGVITKADLTDGDPARAKAMLRRAGVPEPYSPVSVLKKDGLKEWTKTVTTLKGVSENGTRSIGTH